MLFRPEITDTEFPVLLRKFVEITDIQEWDRRIGWIRKQFEQNDFLQSYLRQIYSVELEFDSVLREVAETGQLNMRLQTAERYRLYAFITATAMVHERLTQKGQKRLRGMILGGLRGRGLTSLQQEISVAAHLLGRGFDVSFSDMESGSGFDFLARKGSVEMEIECKRVGLDLGRKIPRLEVLNLHQRIFKEVKPTLKKLRCGLFLRVNLPDRLTAKADQQQAIASAVGHVFRTGVPCSKPECEVLIEEFLIAGSPFIEDAGEVKPALVQQFIGARFNVRDRELLAIGASNKRALVISVASKRSDTVVESLFDDLSISVRAQLSKKRPAVMCVQFIDLTNEQIQRIGSASDDESGPYRPSRIYMETSRFLNSEKRKHVLAIAFRGHGVISKSSERYGNVLRDSIQEQGNAFFVTNEHHPLAKDRRYAIFAAEPEPPSRILTISTG